MLLPLILILSNPQFFFQFFTFVLQNYRRQQKDTESQYLLPVHLLELDHEQQKICPKELNSPSFTLVGNFWRIISDLYDFVMSSLSFFYFLVFWIFNFSASVSRNYFCDSLYSLELSLDAPKASSSENGLFLDVHSLNNNKYDQNCWWENQSWYKMGNNAEHKIKTLSFFDIEIKPHTFGIWIAINLKLGGRDTSIE